MAFHPRESRYGQTGVPRTVRGGDRRALEPEHAPRRVRRRERRRASAATSQLARPGQPGHLAALRRQPADRLRARAGEGPAQDLQLERLPLAADHEGLRQGVRRRGRGRRLLDDRRVDGEDLLGRRRLRRLLPVPGAPRQDGRSGSSCSRSTTTTSRTCRRRSGRRSATRSTTRARGTRCRTRSTRPGSATAPTRSTTDAVGPLEPVRDLLGRAATRGRRTLLDDGREAPIHMLAARTGSPTSNTENPDDIELAKNELKSLLDAVNVKKSRRTTTRTFPRERRGCTRCGPEARSPPSRTSRKGPGPRCSATGTRRTGGA